MSGLWGETPVEAEISSGIAAIEREQITKLRPMEIEGPPLYQPSSHHLPPPSEPYSADLFAIDSLTTHTIQLLQYARKIRSMMQAVQQQVETAKSEDKELPQFNPAPALPECTAPEPKNMLCKPLPFLPKNLESDFVRGIGEEPPAIDNKSCRKLLRRSVAAICAHAGFDNCAESILDTLTDITHGYIQQFTQLMRSAVDREALHGATGFPDVMEQVFHEMGCGSMVTLHDFYQKRVIKYHKHVLNTCHQLRDDYEKLRHPDIKSFEDLKPLLNKKDESSCDIHFPSGDDVDDGEQSTQTDGVESSQEAVYWPSSAIKLNEPLETRVTSIEGYDGDDTQLTADNIPATPLTLGSETGDSIQDPGSVPDYMSPPAATSVRTHTIPPPYKRRKKDH